LAGVTFNVKSGEALIKSDVSNASGKFSVNLNYVKVYILEFSKSVFITK
jgi:hypothetical protein